MSEKTEKTPAAENAPPEKRASARRSGRRRLFLQGGIAALWIALGVLIFARYRGHTLLVDNRDIEDASGTAVRAPDGIRVSVDGGRPLEFFRNDRERYTLGGVKHRIRVEFPGAGSDPVEAAFRLEIKDDSWILSVPALLAGREVFVEPFVFASEPAPEVEELPAAEAY